MEGLVNSMKSAALNVGQMLTPVLKISKFKETGVLTPDEFVIAGDHLVHHCPTWSWAKAVDSSRSWSYLPANKQFLITRNVPCSRRCSDLKYDLSGERVISTSSLEDVDDFEICADDDEWVDTHFVKDGESSALAASSIGDVNSAESTVNDSSSKDEGESIAMDMDSFIEKGMLEDDDPNRFIEPAPRTLSVSKANEDNIVRTRTYDLHITYDRYYQVPRLWLCGYDENKKLLTVEQMYEDFSQDHANKTITIESHPHLHSSQMASIHPCRHAEVMKRLMNQLSKSGKELGVEQYLLIFLKFVQAIIPTVEYDFTRSVLL